MSGINEMLSTHIMLRCTTWVLAAMLTIAMHANIVAIEIPLQGIWIKEPAG